MVHRFTLFAYIQSHIANKSEEALQNVLENSPYWVRVGKGKYKLTNAGYDLMISDFGHKPKKADLESKYIFLRQYQNHSFSVIVNPALRRLTVLVNGVKTPSIEACRSLNHLGATFITDSDSKPRKVLNWIIQDNDFTWERTY
jgi:hypothetical protein